MIKRFFPIMMAVLGCLLFPSCQENETIDVGVEQNIPEGYVAVSFKAHIPDMTEVETRAVDPDGNLIHKDNMTLFCFNEYGLFISTEQAKFSENYQPAEHGTFDAVIPQETSIIHFVANQNPELFKSENFLNQTEDEIQSKMVGASGMLIYWARFESDGDNTTPIKDELLALNAEGDDAYAGIKLIRNQAKVSIADWETQHLVVTGFRTVNIHAFGTTAPYHPQHGFPTCNDTDFGTDAHWWATTDFVTLPENRTMMSDIIGVNTAQADYIFEHENTLENPVSVIIRGHLSGETQDKDKFYRVMLVDANGEQLMIRRNHHYKINIEGALTYGQDSFEKALTAPATNNVWVAVDNWVDEISDGTYTLGVSQTSAVYNELGANEDRNRTFTYTIKREDNAALTAADIAEVSWMDGNEVADYALKNEFDPTTGVGTITIALKRDMGTNQQLTGTLLVKKGRLQRQIEVTLIKTQKFTPAWIAAQVYSGEVGANVTLKFTIPESCPASLFPFSVYISTNSLDIRSASGQQLPVIRKGEEGYFGDDNEWGYKYVHTVEGPGVQRIYFSNILTHDGGATQKVYVEAPFFEKLEKTVTYVEHQRTITMSGLLTYQPKGMSGLADDELVHYVLVPQKVNAPVTFDMVLRDLSGTQDAAGNYPAINAGENDEFLIYSKSLDYYQGTGGTINGQSVTFDCEFGGVSEEIWQETTNGRVAAFRPLVRNGDPANGTGHYSIYMYTNTPVSTDVVRIASNATGAKAYWNGNNVNTSDDVTYKGLTYRSVIFELANYRPFRFNATVNEFGTNENKDHTTTDEEIVSTVSLPYAAPGQEVKISFDVKSFESTTDKKTVDPFGTKFEIYIDAPMLELGDNPHYNGKLQEVGGRFVYTVDASQEVENTYGTDGRKTLTFKTKGITNAGEIKISSNKNQVVFYDKTFKVTNQPITGSLQYAKVGENGTTDTDVPKDAFVSFALKRNGTRIGVMTITEAGQYSLNLRSEYEFGWTSSDDHVTDNRIELNYVDSDNKAYDMIIHDLATLVALAEKKTPIVLTIDDDSDLHVADVSTE